MKITERRLRQIIRSVIKESDFSDDLSSPYMGPDPVQGLGPAGTGNNTKVYTDEDGTRIEEYTDEDGNLWRRDIETGEEWNVTQDVLNADAFNANPSNY